MNISQHQLSDKQIVYAQLLCFTIAFLAVLGNILFPDQIVSLKIIQTSFATGSILLAIKIAREGWDMAAAGYTLLGIAWGILFAGVDFWKVEAGMHIISSAGYFFFPSFLLIAFYNPFPKWIKILAVWCAFPYTVNLILFNIDHDHNVLGFWAELGFVSFHVTSICWSVYFVRMYKKAAKSTLITMENREAINEDIVKPDEMNSEHFPVPPAE